MNLSDWLFIIKAKAYTHQANCKGAILDIEDVMEENILKLEELEQSF